MMLFVNDDAFTIDATAVLIICLPPSLPATASAHTTRVAQSVLPFALAVAGAFSLRRQQCLGIFGGH
jgi:hypothetical protein